jgi:protein kinase A
LFKKIIRGQFKIYGFMSFEAKLLFISLFVPDPAQRLGAGANGWQDLYNLSFFDGLDFKALRKQSLEAPWVPELKNPLDSSNFQELTHVEDKMTINDPPISEVEHQMFHAFDK